MLPKPPSPRSVASSTSASLHATRATGATTIWAMRSPGSTTKGFGNVYAVHGNVFAQRIDVGRRIGVVRIFTVVEFRQNVKIFNNAVYLIF